jgi:hypothetical protein
MPKPTTISNSLRRAIKASPLLPAVIAAKAKLAKSVVSRFANGERGLNLPAVDALAEVLGLELRARGPRERTR